MGDEKISQGAAYGIILGVGFLFAIGMIGTTYFLKKYQNERITSDEFSTAGRHVSSSLISVGVISSWCWPTSMLVSTATVYRYGVCGGLYYAAGCGSVCFIFAVLAMEVKHKAPKCHTYLELIKIRFGSVAHCVYVFFALAVNILVTVELINGASYVFNYLSGMHIVAASFLAVLPVSVYTLFGGLKATFLTDYVHSLIILIIGLVFAFNAYATNSHIGSPGRMYELLQAVAARNPVDGNLDGSLLTFRSSGGAIFELISLSSGLAPIVLDQGYWNKALAAAPSSVMPGYFMGGIAWCALPLSIATIMGLSMRALENTEAFPRFLTEHEVSAGLVLPSAASALMGRNGSACAFLLIFMSVTSAASAEMVSASTILCYDVYRTYLNPRASDRQLIFATHASVVGFVLSLIGISIGLFYGGADVGFLFDIIPIACGGALVPAILTLFWNGLSRKAVIISPILGSLSGIGAYLGTSAGIFGGVINKQTLVTDYPSLAGCLVSCGSPIIYVAIIQLFTGHAHYDFELLKLNQPAEPEIESQVWTNIDIESQVEGKLVASKDAKEPFEADAVQVPLSQTHNRHRHGSSESSSDSACNSTGSDSGDRNRGKITEAVSDYSKATADDTESLPSTKPRHLVILRCICLFMPVALLIIWPMPMYGSNYIFSKEFFTGWVVVSIIWIWGAVLLVGLMPLWQGYATVIEVARGVYKDVTHR